MSTVLLPRPGSAPAPSSRRDAVRGLLGTLLNHEWATRRAAALAPFGRAVRPSVAASAARLAAAADLAPRPVRSVADLELRIADLHRATSPESANAPPIVVTAPAAPSTLRIARDVRFAALHRAARELLEHTGARTLLHGSLATDDWTGYRDADLLLLVPVATAGDAAALGTLRRAMGPLRRALFAFDPLQHHGVFAIADDELVAWPEHFLPVAVLRRALDLGGDGVSLLLRPQHDLAAARAEFDWAIDYFEAASLPTDAYGWKAFASVLMLVPALFLAARGEPCWKADSFARVAPLVPADAWWPQQWAATLRASFRDPTPDWARSLLGIAPEPRLLAQLVRRFAHPPRHLLPHDGPRLLRDTRRLLTLLRTALTMEPART